jgi:hypothetical protein
MRRGLTKLCVEGGLLVAPLLWLVGTHPAVAAGPELRGLATYFILLEAGASYPPGRFDEPAARRISAADWSLDLNRTTAAFGVTGRFGTCELIAVQNLPPARRAAGVAAAVSYHAYVPPSYAYLPIAYQRDFVRSGLVGMTEGTNKLLADAATPADAKLVALGQYLHFAQDVFLLQDAKTGKPFEAGTDSPAQELERDRAASSIVDNGAIIDTALRAFGFTYQLAKVFGQTGALPPLPPADKFDATFYAPLSAADRAQITKTLQGAGVWPYLETMARWSPRPNGSAKTEVPPPNAQADADLAKLKVGLTEVWAGSHTNGLPIRPPQIYAWGGDDFVVYDGHPDWLIRKELRSAEMTARRAIDDQSLAQQASSQLRAKIDRFEAAVKDDTDPQRRNTISVSVDALKKYYIDADAALKQSVAAKAAPDKRRFVGTALQSLRQGLRAAEQTELTVAESRQAAQRGQPAPSPCQDEQAAATAAFNRQLNDIVKTAVAVGFDSVADKLTPEDQQACLMIAFDDVRGALIGGTTEVPEKCRAAASAGRVALARYAAAHIKTLDPDIEALLTKLDARQSEPARPKTP